MFGKIRKEVLLLLLGDLVCLNVALWPWLFYRYYGSPNQDLIWAHLLPFVILFVLTILTFFIAGLYERRTRLFWEGSFHLLLKAQLSVAFIASSLFYLVPVFGIEPRANLFAYLSASSVLVIMWRFIEDRLAHLHRRQPAVIVGTGEGVKELCDEIAHNPRYPLTILAVIEVGTVDRFRLVSSFTSALEQFHPVVVITADSDQRLEPLQSLFYKLADQGIRFITFNDLYEDTFDRVLPSNVSQDWFLGAKSNAAHRLYDVSKRIQDILGVFILSFIVIPVSVIVMAVLKIVNPGPLFISQERIGEHDQVFRLFKFRTWLFDDQGDPELHKQNRLTGPGKFLRKTRIDELPQLINILRGELSFIGPRPEIPKLVANYEEKIPYYRIRHSIKPGLSGWAQINDYDAPREIADVEKTTRKLSYDLYYLKHRSFLLDMKIILRTIKTLLSRTGV